VLTHQGHPDPATVGGDFTRVLLTAETRAEIVAGMKQFMLPGVSGNRTAKQTFAARIAGGHVKADAVDYLARVAKEQVERDEAEFAIGILLEDPTRLSLAADDITIKKGDNDSTKMLKQLDLYKTTKNDFRYIAEYGPVAAKTVQRLIHARRYTA